jgi:hypothetical protein
MAKASLFISHTSEEAELAVAIKRLILDAFGTAVLVYVSSDGQSVRAGDRWLQDLGATLKRSSLHFVLCSETSIKRPWVNFEAGAAWVSDTPTIPICHSGMTPDSLPLPLNTFHGILLGSIDALGRVLDRVAAVVRRRPKTIDVSAWASRLQEIERRTRASMAAHRIIAAPRVFCGTLAPFAQAFAKDVNIVSSVFTDVISRADLTGPEIVRLLSSDQFDILHLYLPVDRENGDVLFQADRLPAYASRELVEGCGASLVVLATCKAVLLAVQVAPVCNMIACDIEIEETEIERWMRLFYPLLGNGRALSSVFRLATQSSSVPMYHLRGDDVAYRGAPSGAAECHGAAGKAEPAAAGVRGYEVAVSAVGEGSKR